MTEWCGQWRTNAFAVKDINELKKILVNYGKDVRLITYADVVNYVTLTGRWDKATAGQYLPVRYAKDDIVQQDPIHLVDEIAPCLPADEVALFIEIGAESHHELTGMVVPVDNNGVRDDLVLKLTDMIDRIKSAGYKTVNPDGLV